MEDWIQRVAQIRNDTEHGSRWLARQATLLLYELAVQPAVSSEERLEAVHQAARELARARPAMAALAGAVGRILVVPGGPANMAAAAQQLLSEYDSAIASIATFARKRLEGTVMTHSLSGTVLEVLQACAPPIEQFIALESRPLYEGRTTASALSAQSAAVTLITDAQADIFLPQCQAVVVGADSILADGGILNKAGTALLARAAFTRTVPLYVVTETLKITARPWDGNLHRLEEHTGSEVWPQAAPEVRVRNFYFDYTPAELITEILTERGPLTRAEIERQATLLRQIPELT